MGETRTNCGHVPATRPASQPYIFHGHVHVTPFRSEIFQCTKGGKGVPTTKSPLGAFTRSPRPCHRSRLGQKPKAAAVKPSGLLGMLAAAG